MPDQEQNRLHMVAIIPIIIGHIQTNTSGSKELSIFSTGTTGTNYKINNIHVGDNEESVASRDSRRGPVRDGRAHMEPPRMTA